MDCLVSVCHISHSGEFPFVSANVAQWWGALGVPINVEVSGWVHL